MFGKPCSRLSALQSCQRANMSTATGVLSPLREKPSVTISPVSAMCGAGVAERLSRVAMGPCAACGASFLCAGRAIIYARILICGEVRLSKNPTTPGQVSNLESVGLPMAFADFITVVVDSFGYRSPLRVFPASMVFPGLFASPSGASPPRCFFARGRATKHRGDVRLFGVAHGYR